MSRKIVAIGGGENWRMKEWIRKPYETEPIDKEIIRLTGKEHPNFLFLWHAQAESLERQESYFEAMKDIYGWRYGCDCKDLKSNKLTDMEYAKNLVDWADIIYEWWWDTFDMVQLWKSTWFDKILKEARENWKVMCGLSAWANCWFKKCSTDSPKAKKSPDQQSTKMDCLDFVDWLFVPHADNIDRQESVKQLLKEESQEIWLLLSNCAALEIIDDKYRVITSDASNYPIEKAFWKKTYRKNNEYIQENIDDFIEFKSLSDLYTKL
jgi:peptidase E